MKHLHKDSVSSLLWNFCAVLLSVWAVPRPQWMGFTPAPCFHASAFFSFWYMEFYRTSFIKGSNFAQNLSKMLFYLNAFPSSTSRSFQSLAQVTENTVIDIYYAVICTNLSQKHPKKVFFIKVSTHLPSLISEVHGQRCVMHTNTWDMNCLGVLKSWSKAFDAFTPHICTISKLLPAVTLAPETWRKNKVFFVFLFSAILPMNLRFLKPC